MSVAGFLTLIVALKGTTDFKETRFFCSEYNYTYEVEGRPNAFIVVKNIDYETQYTSQDELQKKVEKECPTRK